MDVIIHRAAPVRGIISLPPDKAICHRALLAAALASGDTELTPWPLADDCQRTLALIQTLGVQVSRTAGGMTVHGQGRLQAPSRDLDCGESGTTLRLAAGVLAGWPFGARLTASPSLSRRPMQRIVTPLMRMGARLEGATHRAESQDVYPPLTIRGRRPLSAITYPMEAASAQVKSAILFAGLHADGTTTVIEHLPTRDHTERLLRHFGARIQQQGGTVSVEPGLLCSPGRLVLPGDVSSAAFFIVAACCVAGSRLELQGVGLNPSRTRLLKVLGRMGAAVHLSALDDAWEPRGTIVVEAHLLQGTVVSAEEAPGVIDELPILMVAAACARGTTRFEGIGELRVKETDRIRSMATGLERLGASVRLPAPDVVEIDGGTLAGGTVDSAGDHRTAMSLSVAGLMAQGQGTTVQGAECVGKSFPEFFALLAQIAGPSTVKTVDKA